MKDRPTIQEVADVMDEVTRTFRAMKAASKSFQLTKKPEKVEAARKRYLEAEQEYRKAAVKRDAICRGIS